ncbi:MAG: ABC transporter permease [Candidatus Binataceae bacterium]
MIPIRYNLRSLMVRRTTSLMTTLGVALVVMIVFILLGFTAGLRRTMLQSGAGGAWIILSRGVTSEPGSYITREQYEILRSRPEIAADGSGQPLISPEAVTGFDATADSVASNSGFAFLRGVYPVAYQVHRKMRIVSGRWPARGQSEMATGRKLAIRYPNLTPSHRIRFGRRMWTIVGVFADGGSTRESEVWTDLDVMQQDIRYANGFASLHVVLKPGMENSLKQGLTKDARLKVDLTSEREFYTAQSKLADQLRALGLVVAAVLGIGAAFGGMNTMYAAVARRGKEIGVLRALGFSRTDVLIGFVIESVALAVAGGVVGELLGLGIASVTGLFSRQMKAGMLIFSFSLSPSAFTWSLAAAVLIGALGGLLPAWRAARLGVITSLREA